MNAELPPDPPTDPALARLVDGLDAAASSSPATLPEDDAVAAVVTQLRSRATWDGPPAYLRDTVLARALEQRSAVPAGRAAPVAEKGLAPVVALPRWRRLAWAVPMTAVAAVVLTVLVLTGQRLLTRPDPGTSYSLAAGSYAPTASGTVSVGNAPGGFPIVLDAHNLPGAPAGYYYEAWLVREGQPSISLGTFHARKTGQPIKLWSGVDPAGYRFSVRLQSVSAPPAPNGPVVITSTLSR